MNYLYYRITLIRLLVQFGDKQINTVSSELRIILTKGSSGLRVI